MNHIFLTPDNRSQLMACVRCFDGIDLWNAHFYYIFKLIALWLYEGCIGIGARLLVCKRIGKIWSKFLPFVFLLWELTYFFFLTDSTPWYQNSIAEPWSVVEPQASKVGIQMPTTKFNDIIHWQFILQTEWRGKNFIYFFPVELVANTYC